jgi:hypothetical protein
VFFATKMFYLQNTPIRITFYVRPTFTSKFSAAISANFVFHCNIKLDTGYLELSLFLFCSLMVGTNKPLIRIHTIVQKLTGDITDEGLLFQFERARAEISRFNCANIIVLAGNHDYRCTGNLLFRRFFPSSKRIYDFNDSVEVLTVGTARPDLDKGEVGHRQNLWMERNMS